MSMNRRQFALSLGALLTSASVPALAVPDYSDGVTGFPVPWWVLLHVRNPSVDVCARTIRAGMDVVTFQFDDPTFVKDANIVRIGHGIVYRRTFAEVFVTPWETFSVDVPWRVIQDLWEFDQRFGWR